MGNHESTDAATKAGATSKNLFPPPPDFAAKAHVKSLGDYQKMYQRSIDDPDGFWAEVADGFHWQQKWSKGRATGWLS